MKINEHPYAQTIWFQSKTDVQRVHHMGRLHPARGFEGALWTSKGFWSALQSVRPKESRVSKWSSDMVMNTLSAAMSDKLPSLSLQLLVSEQCPTFCPLSSLLLLSQLPQVQHGGYFYAALASSSRRCVALQQQAWTAAVSESC